MNPSESVDSFYISVGFESGSCGTTVQQSIDLAKGSNN